MSTPGTTPPSDVTPASATALRRRAVWTAVLVLVALGGAGLVTAADRAPTDEARPELTWRAEQQAAPLLADMRMELAALGGALDRLADAARRTLAGVPALDIDALTDALDDGDLAATDVAQRAQALAAIRQAQERLVADERLRHATGDGLAALDEALAAAQELPGTWIGVAARTRPVVDLLAALDEHDRLVLEATAAGRDADWPRALDLLEDAGQQLRLARGARDSLAAAGDVATLDDLVARYADFDEALTELYAEIERTGTDQGPEVDDLRAEVERARAALPQSTDALSVAVGEAAGDGLARALVRIEQARGDVAEARSALGDE